MKIIFLDIDGVLFTNNHYSFLTLNRQKIRDKFGFYFDPACIIRFNEIIDKTNAKIVISSSWKMQGVQNLKECFIDRGIKGEIIDVTTSMTSEGKFFFCREDEIKYWLNKNVVDNYAVVDDLDLDIDNFVKTSMKDGITENVKDKIINILI